MNLPLVSIAMATYNGEKFVEQQIQSLLAQDYPNLEIVISDDCSQDRTWEILERYAALDNRIRLLPRTVNLGYVGNFIRVFSECKGELISPCDQDDIWYPNKTSRLVEEMGDATLIYCNNRFIDENNSSLGVLFSDTVKCMVSGSDGRNFLFYNSISGHAMLFRKELLNKIDDLASIHYIDWLIAFFAAEYGSIKYLDQVLVDWRQHAESTTFSSRNGKQKAQALIIDDKVLQVFSSIESKHKSLMRKAYSSWIKWKSSYFNLSMFIFVIRYGNITHKYHPAKYPALKYLLGYKLKKLLRPNHY